MTMVSSARRPSAIRSLTGARKLNSRISIWRRARASRSSGGSTSKAGARASAASTDRPGRQRDHARAQRAGHVGRGDISCTYY
jgi:hypothetical protein